MVPSFSCVEGPSRCLPAVGQGCLSRYLSLALSALLLVYAVLSGCQSRLPPVSIEWVESEEFRWRSLVYEGVSGGRFTEISPSTTGIHASTDLSLETRLGNRTLAHGTGIALGDMDGDGWVDIYVCLLDAPNVLYRNLGGWEFENVTMTAGAGLPGRMSRGAVFADADGDGDLDLFVAIHGGVNVLLTNDGSGHFVESASGFEGAYGTTTLGLADIDGDADLDAYFTNYKVIQGDDLFSPSERSMQGKIREVEGGYEFIPPFDEHYRVERIGDRVRRWELADPDELYLNDGMGRFENVDFTGGMFRTAEGTPIREIPRSWGLVPRFFDADDDGDPDLYVANDFGSDDGIWFNEGGWFRAASGLQVRTTSASSMGVDFSDIDGDRDTDFITTEMLAFDLVRRREQAHPLQDGRAQAAIVPRTLPGEGSIRARVGRNTLQVNRGDGTFAEVGRSAGVDASEWTWGAMFLDVDLDGYEDLLITNGHTWDPLDGDTQDRLRTGQIQVDWQRENGVFPLLRLKNLAFANQGDGTFEESGERWGYGADPDVSHGIAAADFDRDGDLDVVVTRMNEPPLVLRNDAAARRTAVRLRGWAGNTQAIGARVELENGALPIQTRQVTSGGMYLSGSDPLLVFGMGTKDSARLRVTWPTGGVSTFQVGADILYEIYAPEQAPTSQRVSPTDVEPLFHPSIVGSQHHESEFNELARQPLIPLELSRLGPGVSWEDVDGDGDPDLLLPSGAGGQALLMRNEGGRLGDPDPFGPFSTGDQTTIVAIPGHTKSEILAGVSSWESPNPDALLRISPIMGISGQGDIDVRATVDATGPIAAADVDADGDLDLFVGGRAVPGAYPRPASSRILVNQGGTLVADPVRSQPFGAVGLVSGAIFSDVDLDGDPDLLLALDWGPIRLFLNEGSGYRDATDAWGLSQYPGRWNGIATGDLNADGRPDLVVTGWGNNTGKRATPLLPVGLHAADLDGNGLVDIIESWTEASGDELPARGYLSLSTALPFIRRGAPSYEAFARSTVVDLLGPRQTDVEVVRAATLEHTMFLNRNGSFEAQLLPARTQRAPGFGVVVADFDLNGTEDVFMAQNFLSTPAGIARYDAGRGELLLGDGRGSLTTIGAQQSGITVYGDARGAAVADFDEDGRWDLAVGQNGEEVLIFRGAANPSGLRVHLVGGISNPDAVGASLRVVYADGEGPLREIQAGSGYWSKNGNVQVFGLRANPQGVQIRWPGGRNEFFKMDPSSRDVVLRMGMGQN